MILRCLAVGLLAFLSVTAAGSVRALADMPVVKIAVLKFGTVNWLMDTVRLRGLDAEEGFELDVLGLAGKPATDIAFQSGEVDLVVTDWIWALGQRAKGKDLRFSPYLNASGALVTTPDLGGLCALRGKRVGVVGGAKDKSWLILQALAERDCGFDLVKETEALFGAPPLMSRQLTGGAVDAVSTYWHFVAKLEAAGMEQSIRISEALAELGVDPAPPLIGFVWDPARTEQAKTQAFLRAVARAGEILATDDAMWEALRPKMRVKTDAEFTGLRDAYRAGIPEPWTASDTASSRKLYDLLVSLGGPSLAQSTGPFDPDVFNNP
ncbi:MAG: ABC transporter substrate-binding protein [Pseudomonadota bacterium]